MSIRGAQIVVVAALALLGGLITLIVFTIRSQGGEFVESAALGFEQLVRFVEDSPLPVDEVDVDALGELAVEFVSSAQFGSGTVTGVALLGEFLAGLVLLIVLLFLFLEDGDRIGEFLLHPFEGAGLERGRRIG